MSDQFLDLSAPQPDPAPAPATSAAPAPAGGPALAPPAQGEGVLVLTPPEPATAVEPTAAASMLPIAAEKSAELGERARSFVSTLTALDARSPEFATRIADIESMGRADIRASAEVSNRMLDRPVSALAAAKGAGGDTGQAKVASSLVDLRLTVEDLDPKRQDGSLLETIKSFIPFRNEIKSYFVRYQSAQTQLNAIIKALESGADSLRRDNASIDGEKARLWETMTRLQEYAVMTQALDHRLAEAIEDIRPTDPEKADALTADMLFAVRQKNQDLLTQLAVSVQGYLALDLVRKNNNELIKGVDRATTTTVAALRTAVVVAQALADQKLVLDQIDALNTTTSNMILTTSEMLRQQTQRVNEQASTSGVDMKSLEQAFTNIYATIDAIDAYKVEAVSTMQTTVDSLTTQLQGAEAYLERSRRGDESQGQLR